MRRALAAGCGPGTRPRARPRDGFALLVVLLVLIALLVLAAPFLLMARNADRASTELSDRAQARLALDSAARHARLQLGESHSGLDQTPYFDSLEEVAVDNRFDPAFLDASDEKGLMWDVDRQDVAGEIDLGSAPPQMIANLMGVSTRFARAIKPDEKELPLASTAGLEPAGVVWSNGELVRYGKIAEGALAEPVRGVLGPADASQWRGGPLPPSVHDAGAPVIDQRAFAPALWRIATADGEIRALDSKERLREAGAFALAAALSKSTDPRAAARKALSEDALRPLFRYGSVQGGVRGGPVWQHPVRLASAVQGGQDGILRVDIARWLNPGSTVQISDGASTELALVQEVRRSGEIVLDRVLVNDYQPYLAVVRVLARRPVNLNTACPPVLEAVFANLQLVGRNSRITRDEAQKLAQLVVESRPFEGFEDFLRRVVLPAAGVEKLPNDAPVVPPILAGLSGEGGFIDPDDALALYTNGLNANDAGLLYSTMPYSFVTRDTYDLELRATVDAPSGAERFSLVREEADLVVPQREVLELWARQEDFEEALRLDLEAPWWMTAPSATSRWDNGSAPPSRLWAHMGTAEGQAYLPGVTDTSAFKDRESPPTAEHVFASREEAGWIQLWPSRVSEASQRLKDRVLHFDHETRNPEGRYLPDQVVSRATDDKQVGWTGMAGSPLLRPLSLSMWVKPRAIADGLLLDIGGTSHDTDRVSLRLDGPDLVLRVISAGGDHPDTPQKEWGEARFAVAKGQSPGLPVDVWSHVEVDVRGNRPDQISLLVNGLAHGVRTPGLTRLTAAIPQNAAILPVESAEGFPASCTVRLGNELVEVTVDNGQLRAARQEIGAFAGFGGRIARDRFASQTTDSLDVPAALAQTTTAHPAGTAVELAGYSLPLVSDVPAGQGTLGAAIGPFRVGRLAGVARANGAPFPGDDISFAGLLGSYPVGTGMEGGPNSQVGALVLECADAPNVAPADFMPAFSTTGGYAMVVQVVKDNDPTNNKTDVGTQFGGIEIIRYSGYQGTTLLMAARGVDQELPDLRNLPANLGAKIGGRRAFVANFTSWWVSDNQVMQWRCYVIPISLGVAGADGLRATVPEARKDRSRVLQVTHVQDAEKTEWVRYDHQDASGQFVRDDPEALRTVYDRIISPIDLSPHQGTAIAAGPGSEMLVVATRPPPPAQSYGSQWLPEIGKSENETQGRSFFFSSCVSDTLQFRGVLGTYSHQHPAGTLVLPVFNVELGSIDSGRPGRLDAAFLIGAVFDHLGWPVHVHRAHIPANNLGARQWKQPDLQTLTAVSAGELVSAQKIFLRDSIFVGLQARAPEPMRPGTVDPSGATNINDTRAITRLCCFPSGERPRMVSRMAVGGGFDGQQSGAVPSAVVDEIVFGDAQFGRKAPGDADTLAGASFVLNTEVAEEQLQIQVLPKALRTARGDYGLNYEFLGETPQDAGLLRIGEEILCYDHRDPTTGDIAVAPGGRGLLGTRPQPHHTTEPVTFLEHHAVTFLAGGLAAGDATISVASTEDFPPDGTVLIGSELIHYTHIRDAALEMPRASSVPGKMDHKGDGLFRGRYGTLAAGHAQGEPVILFPFRYWDRWQSRADAPELSYFTLSIDQPSAYWGSCFFFKDDTESGQIGILEKTDPEAPWDADPETDKRLHLYWKGDVEGKPIPIGRQSDRIDWRVFVKYAPGAFDLKTGLGHGWKETPRLTRFGAFYFGPGMVLSSVER